MKNSSVKHVLKKFGNLQPRLGYLRLVWECLLGANSRLGRRYLHLFIRIKGVSQAGTDAEMLEYQHSEKFLRSKT